MLCYVLMQVIHIPEHICLKHKIFMNVSYEMIVSALRVAQMRGEAMQTASEMEPGGMLTVMYFPTTKIHEVIAKAKEYAIEQKIEKPVCEVAHYLFPHCKVIAGHIQVSFNYFLSL
jgi:malonyl CoA-acyl carrier protein transacylase